MSFLRNGLGASFVWVMILAVLVTAETATAVGFDQDDFIITSYTSDSIGVYNFDWTFKGYLDTGYNSVSGLDFDADGRLVAAGRSPDEVRVYSSDGLNLGGLGFTNNDLGSPIDLKVTPTGRYLVGTQYGLVEFNTDGSTSRTFAGGDYQGVVMVGGGFAWGGIINGGSSLDVFDLLTGNKTGSIPLDNGQINADSMSYSSATGTVLIADEGSKAIYERDTDGTFIRSFNATSLGRTFGVTRGPGGDVFASSYDGSFQVFQWRADGTYVGAFALPDINGPTNIVWAGNAVPEPAVVGLLGIGCLVLMHKRRCA